MKPRDVNSELTSEHLRQVVMYEPETGKFFWLFDKNQNVKAGHEAGCPENTGYIRITINGRRYQAHRLAWLYMTGKWPVERIDHKNLLKSDNRWVNLRSACDTENMANKCVNSNNMLGIKGVRLHESGKYIARICKGGKPIYLGVYESAQEAQKAYAEKAKELFGEFARVA